MDGIEKHRRQLKAEQIIMIAEKLPGGFYNARSKE